MDDVELQSSKTSNNRNAQTHADRNISEPVRSRWTPKPEQILILESIFNSGMVNPPKDETVRIRKLLEKFGTVGDANVFYWFQNRRSRSRRRQRQMQAGLVVDNNLVDAHSFQTTSSGVQSSYDCGFGGSGFLQPSFSPMAGYFAGGGGVSSSSVSGSDGFDDLFAMTSQMGVMGMDHGSDVSSIFGFSDSSNMQFRPHGFVTVFINGVATELPRGPLDMKGLFGDDNEYVLVHSSGVPLPVNDFGFSTQSLQHGESYFLVSRTS